MPVAFKSKVNPVGPSNKHVGGGEGTMGIEWSYMYKYGKGDTAYVSVPSIDKISVTVVVTDPDRRGTIYETLIMAIKEKKLWTTLGNEKSKEDSVPGFSVVNAPKKLGYKVGASFKLDGIEEPVWVHADLSQSPKNGSFARIELNPRALGPEGLERFKKVLAETTLGALEWDHVISDGKVTRFDAAVEMYNVPTEDLVWSSTVVGKTIIYTDPDGKRQSIYIGQKTNSQMYLYNKLAASQDKNKPVAFPGHHTRVEVRSAPMCPFECLASAENPLARLKVYHPDAAPPGLEAWTYQSILMACAQSGVDKALLSLPDHVRTELIPYLDASTAKAWKPGKLWNHWPQVVSASGLLTPYESAFETDSKGGGTLPHHMGSLPAIGAVVMENMDSYL